MTEIMFFLMQPIVCLLETELLQFVGFLALLQIYHLLTVLFVRQSRLVFLKLLLFFFLFSFQHLVHQGDNWTQFQDGAWDQVFEQQRRCGIIHCNPFDADSRLSEFCQRVFYVFEFLALWCCAAICSHGWSLPFFATRTSLRCSKRLFRDTKRFTELFQNNVSGMVVFVPVHEHKK